MSSLENIQNKLMPIFEQEPIFLAVLFGSYAKDTADAHSDVDIMIDSQGQLIGLDFYRVLDLIVNALGTQVDLIEISEIEKSSPLLDTILQEGVVLYDRQVA